MLSINRGEIYVTYLGLKVIETDCAKSTNGTLKFVFKFYFFLNECTERKQFLKNYHKQLMFIVYL